MYRAILLLLLIANLSLAQDSYITGDPKHSIDSLNNLIKAGKEDTSLVDHLTDIGWLYCQTGDYENSQLSCRSAIILSEKLNYKLGLANAFTIIANVQWHQGNYPEALKTWFDALKIGEELKHFRTIANTYHGIALIYDEQRNYKDALKYNQMALAIKKKINDKQGIAASYNDIGNVYYAEGKNAEALEQYEIALKIAKEIGYKKGMKNCYGNIGNIYSIEKKFPESLENYMKALQLSEEINDTEGKVVNYICLGSLYYEWGKLKDSKNYVLMALDLSKKIGSKQRLSECYLGLSDIATAEKNSKEALANYKLHILYSDSLNNEENTKKTVRLEMQYAFNKKEAEQKLEQENKDAIAAAENKKRKIILLAISVLGLLISGFAIFAYRSFLQKKKANGEITRQKHLIEEKQKEILDSIYYARRIQRSLLPRETYIEKRLKSL